MCIVHSNSLRGMWRNDYIHHCMWANTLQSAIILEYQSTVVVFIPSEPPSSTSVHITEVDPQINYVTGQTTTVRAEKVNCLYSHYNGARARITL